MTLRSFIKQWRCQNAGSAAIEFAITAPLLFGFVIGVTDFGLLMNRTAALEAATRAGAEYAKLNYTDNANIQSRVTNFQAFAPVVTSSTSTFCTCNDAAATVVTCPASGATNPCSAVSATDPRVLMYMTVSAAQDFAPIAQFTSYAFPSTLRASTIVRIQ